MSEAARLRLALGNLSGGDWEVFERFCSAFLADDFPELRTIAGVGDQGRDATLHSPDRPNVVIQYSIVENWKSKIESTLSRLAEAEIGVAGLVYVTNRDVGTRADSLKGDLLKDGVLLDVRDRSFFLDRVHLSAGKLAAARELNRLVADPLLATEEIMRNSAVSDGELRAGLLYLELQLHDAAEARNLTKLSYDALVLAALADTEPDSQLPRTQIRDAVGRHLPGHPPDRVRSSVDGALQRLKARGRIAVTGSTDSFSLHHQERLRQAERAAEIAGERDAVRHELASVLVAACGDLDLEFPTDGQDALVDALDSVLQGVLERQGYRFADAVRNHNATLRREDVLPIAEDIVTRRAAALGLLNLTHDQLAELTMEALLRAFVLPPGAVQGYLREMADAYTLLAFMRESPDVQNAVSHFFSRGQLVLDTTVLLPTIAETLLSTEDQRYTNLLRGASEAGMDLLITEGVLEEIDTHLNRALICYQMGSGWNGEPPLVLDLWRQFGGGGDFRAFIEKFRGDGGPAGIQVFLQYALRASLTDLDRTAAGAIPGEARHEFTEVWRPRKKLRPGRSEAERDILLRHDVEMFLGVVGLRKHERPDVFGYEAWWVTTDPTAHGMFRAARSNGVNVPSNPCMDPAFLTNLLSIGPTRGRLDASSRLLLPAALDIQRRGWGDKELSDLADAIRGQNDGEPEWLVRRRIRDAVNKVKAERAEMAQAETQLGADSEDEVPAEA